MCSVDHLFFVDPMTDQARTRQTRIFCESLSKIFIVKDRFFIAFAYNDVSIFALTTPVLCNVYSTSGPSAVTLLLTVQIPFIFCRLFIIDLDPIGGRMSCPHGHDVSSLHGSGIGNEIRRRPGWKSPHPRRSRPPHHGG